MIGYVTFGTNDFDKAIEFYDKLFNEIGAKRAFELEGFIAWGVNPKSPMLAITKPYNKEIATAGNGTMVALMMDSQDKVDLIHKKAMELGGTDEGKPGLRGKSGFYAGYFRDLDGNKLNAFCFG